MAATALVDTGFLIALLDARDRHHHWAADLASRQPPPWTTCEAVLSEAFHMLGPRDAEALVALLRRYAILASFRFEQSTELVLTLMQKYADVPMSFADACLVRMTEVLPDPVLLTTDADFQAARPAGGAMPDARMRVA
jgi:predicted nucleic acid-binding protein